MKITKYLATYLIAATLSIISFAPDASAQNGIMTPYSSYGYGILRDNATSAQRSMGGIGYAMNSGRQINVMNPASYAHVDSLTFLFDMGITLTKVWSSEKGAEGFNNEQNFGGGLDYITIQFPVAKNFGMSAGVLPYSSVGYSFGSKIKYGEVSHQGDGSWNLLYLGAGYRPFNGFSIGFNIAYMFGKIYSDSYTTPITGGTALFERQLDVKDWHLDLGAQYSFYSSPINRFTLGLKYSPKKDLHGNIYTYYYLTSNEDIIPEEKECSPLKNGYSLPETWGGGISWEWNKKLFVEADITYQPWSKAKYLGALQEVDNTDARLHNRTKYALGFQYMPSQRGSYFEKIRYRMGGYYSDDYQMVKGNNVREYGVSLGFGLPVPSFKTMINLGLEWRHRQAYPKALVKENYLNITLGINFNEMWFRKSKIY